MALKYIQYKNCWKLTYRDPWAGRPRVRSWKGEGAEAEARAFEKAISEQYERERALLKRAKRRASASSSRSLTVAELLERYLQALENPATRKASAYHIISILDIFGKRRALRMTLDDVDGWIAVQQSRGVGASTINRRASILRAAYNWGTRSRHIPTNPLSGLRLKKVEPQRITPPSAHEARLIYRAAAPHIQRVVLLGMALGPRIGPSELFRLEWSRVDLQERIVYMPNAKKGARTADRAIPIPKDALEALRAWAKEDAKAQCPYVIHHQGRKVRSISTGWHNALRRAGITRRIRPYDLRHAFATRLLAHTPALKAVSTAMGHVDERMILRHYQHVSLRELRKAVDAAPRLKLYEASGGPMQKAVDSCGQRASVRSRGGDYESNQPIYCSKQGMVPL